MKRIFFVWRRFCSSPAPIPPGHSRTRSRPCAPRSRKQQVVIAQLLKRIEALEKQPRRRRPPSLQDLAGRHQGAGRLRQLAARDRQQQGESERLLQLQVLRRRLGRADGLPAAPSRRADGEAARQVQFPDGARAAERAASRRNRAGRRRGARGGRWRRDLRRPTSAAKARWPSRTPGWNTITTAFLASGVGKQLSPQYWWQNHYPNLTLSTALPIYLRELFPAELVGVMVQGSAARPVGTSEFGVGYKFYVANNNFEGNSRTRSARRQVVGRARAGALPDGGSIAALRRGSGCLSRPCRA